MNEKGRLKYANILLETTPQKRNFATGFGSPPLKERILMLTSKRKNRLICLVLAIILAAGAVGCSFGSVGSDTESGEISGDDTKDSEDTTGEDTEPAETDAACLELPEMPRYLVAMMPHEMKAFSASSADGNTTFLLYDDSMVFYFVQ